MKISALTLTTLLFASNAMATSTPLAVSEKGEHSLGSDVLRVSVQLPETALAAMRRPNSSQRLRVVIEDIRLMHPGAVYQVYLNLPAAQEPDPKGPHYLGHLSIFSTVREDDPGARRSFDITEQVRGFNDGGQWTGKLELSFIRGNPEPDVEAPKEFLRFSHIVVIERRADALP